MQLFDWIILVAYMAVVLLVGALAGKKNESEEDYFKGGRSMPWFAVGISVALTMLSAGGFIGGPGWGYKAGLLSLSVRMAVPLCIIFATYTILPIIYHSNVTTVGEYLNKRFGSRTRLLIVVVWLINSLILIGGFVYAPALVLEAITGVNLDVWVPVIVVISIIYTIAGGIRAVIWTDTMQGIVMFIGVIIAVGIAVSGIGAPIGETLAIAGEAGLTQSFVFEFTWSDYNVWLALIAGFMCWISYFGFNQEQVQRYITSKNIREVKKTGIVSTITMQGIHWTCYILGIILFVYYQTHAPQLDFENANNIMVDFILYHCPTGLVGIMLAAIFAAAMSSLDSVLNSATAVFTKDIYEPHFSKGKPATLKLSMTFTAVIGVVVIIFVYLYLGDSTKSILETIGSLTAPFQGVLSGIMMCTLFLPKVNDKGCCYGTALAIVASLIIKNYEGVLGVNWMWGYVYSALLAIILSMIISAFTKNEEETKSTYPYTLYGSVELLKGKTDETGCSMEPLKFDRYAYITFGLFVVHMALLAWLQSL